MTPDGLNRVSALLIDPDALGPAFYDFGLELRRVLTPLLLDYADVVTKFDRLVSELTSTMPPADADVCERCRGFGEVPINPDVADPTLLRMRECICMSTWRLSNG